MPTTITTRVEDDIVRDIDSVAKQEAIDRSAVIRRFLLASVKEWKIQHSLDHYQGGKMTLWRAAQKSGISLWEMIEEVKKRRLHVPYGIEELQQDIEGL